MGRGIFGLVVGRGVSFLVSLFLVCFLNSPAHATSWFVNDLSTTSDSFTSAAGYDTQSGMAPDSPKRTITSVMPLMSPGDTVYVDAGTYAETVVIDTNNVALIGADSVLTVIDFGDSSSGTGANGIYADTQTGLILSNFKIRNCDIGVNWVNVKTSRIDRVALDQIGTYGIRLLSRSDTNQVMTCSSSMAIQIGTSFGNTVSNCLANNYYLSGGSESNTLRENSARGGSTGFQLNAAHRNAFIGNSSSDNTLSGINSHGFVLFASTYNTFSGNTSANNSGRGFYLFSNCDNNTLTANTAQNNSSDGFKLSQSSGNVLSGNTSSNNQGGGSAIGFYLSTSSNNNTMTENSSLNNASDGFYIASSNDNTLIANRSAGNYAGFGLLATQNNYLAQNSVESCVSWGFYIDVSTSNDMFYKNDFTASPYRPDSAVFNNTASSVSFIDNWWGTTDSNALKAKIWGTGRNVITYTPFSLSFIDTAVGADTVAPRAPDTVAAAPLNSANILVTWDSVTASAAPEAVLGLRGYRVFRASSADSSSWILRGGVDSTVRSYTDSGLAAGETWYYRVTAFDNASPYQNQSFLSDSVGSATTPFLQDTSGPNIWYVNDLSTAGDSFTSAVGYDTQSGLLPSTPKRSLAAMMALLTAGDTVYVDSGVFAETVTISANGVALIGKDSSSSIITVGGILADTKSGLIIRNLGIVSSYYGIRLQNVDNSLVENMAVSGNGISLLVGSEANTIRQCLIVSGVTGYQLTNGSNGNTIESCVANNPSENAFQLTNVSANTLTGNYVPIVGAAAFGLDTSTGNALINNRVDAAGANLGGNGFTLNVSSGNVLRGNTVANAANSGFYLGSSSNGNMLVGNVAEANGSQNWGNIEDDGGFEVEASSNNTFIQNTSRATTFMGPGGDGYGFVIKGASGADTFQKNDLSQEGAAVVYNEAGGVTDFRRNWWGTTDTVVIYSRIAGAAMATTQFAPFRLITVDTSFSADTVAPRAPDTVAATPLSASAIRITWALTAGSEEDGAAGGLFKHRVYMATSPTASNWTLVAEVPGMGVTSYDSTGMDEAESRYYRVSSQDNAVMPNGSFYSDSIALGQTWYRTLVALRPDQPVSADVQKGSTFSILSFGLRGDPTVADSLQVISVDLAGNPANVETVSLYVDANRNGQLNAGDTLVATLAAQGAAVYANANVSWPLPAGSADTFLVAVKLRDTAAYNDTVSAFLSPFTITTLRADSGPTALVNAPGVFTILADTQTVVTMNADSPMSGSVLPPDSRVVIALTVRGDTSTTDTLAAVAIAFQGDTNNIVNVALYEDADNNVRLGGADTLVAMLSLTASGRYENTAIGYVMGNAARNFIVVATFPDTAALGISLRAYVPALRVKTALKDSGPNAILASPAIITLSPNLAGPNAWYVNDNSTFGDSYTSEVGDDLNVGYVKNRPKLTISSVMPLLSAGDSVYIDVGTFQETVVIPISNVTLLGADSRLTIVDANWSSETGIGAVNVSGLRIANLQMINADLGFGAGLWFVNVDSSIIENDSFTSNYNGLQLDGGSDSNTIRSCYFKANTNWGLAAERSSRNYAVQNNLTNSLSIDINSDTWTISGNTFTSGDLVVNQSIHDTLSNNILTGGSITLTSATRCYIFANTLSLGQISVGFGSSGAVVDSNSVDYSGGTCFDLICAASTFTNNVATGGGVPGYGFWLNGQASGNTLTGNTANGKQNDGFLVQGAANTLVNNAARNCKRGYRIDGDTNVLRGNMARTSSNGYGFSIEGRSGSYLGNTASENSSHGFTLTGVVSAGNVLTQNFADSNLGYGVNVTATAGAGNTFLRNDLVPPPGRDSGLLYDTTVVTNFTRTWWGTTDSAAVRNRIKGSGAANAQYYPFRLGFVDTAAGADTVAPRAPDTVAASALTVTSARITWATVTNDEEADTNATNVTTYRVYRSVTADTSVWSQVASLGSGTKTFDDTNLWPGTYYYRVTTADNASPYENQSWFSDSIVSVTVGDTSGPNTWYVNDTSMTGDSFTAAIGSDANHGLSPVSPKRTLGAVTPFLTAGDTVYIDSGVYRDTSTFVGVTAVMLINANNVTIIGVDSNATILDPGDQSGGSNIRGIYADTITGLVIRNLRVSNAYNGIEWYNVDNSLINGVLTQYCGNNGVYLLHSDTNTLSNGINSWNVNGIYLASSLGNTVAGGEFNWNVSEGLRLDSSSYNTLNGVTVSSNGEENVHLNSSSNNLLINNYVTQSGDAGIWLEFGSNNLLTDNSIISNPYGIWLDTSSNNLLRGNSCLNNSRDGISLLGGSHDNTVVQNQLDSNAWYQINIGGTSSADTFIKNNIRTSAGKPDSGIFNATNNRFDFTRNWWSSTDSAAIKAEIWGAGRDSVIFAPYRLNLVDTTAGADTIAPKSPDTVALIGAAISCTITWKASSLDENNGVQTGFAGYRIYRASAETATLWTLIGNAATTSFTDSGLNSGDTYFYRVTARDSNAAYGNESYYSDSIVSFAALLKNGDFSQDGTIDAADIMLMLPRYLVPGLYSAIYDIGRGGADGVINEEDFFELGRRFGQ